MRRPFTFLAALLLLAACGQKSGTGQPNVNPVAVFSNSTSGLTVSVDASASVDPDGSIVAYNWNFGDGGNAAGITAQHTYAAAGSYAVTLTVIDNSGGQANSQQTVTVSAGGGGGGGGGGSGQGTVSGALTYGSLRPEHFVAGELIVRFADTGLQTLSTELQAMGLSLQLAAPMALPQSGLYVNKALGHEETLALAQALEARPDVLYAVPNRRVYPLRTPNDEFYSYQWHYPAMNLPAAWDITTGKSGTVVAVVDSGILWEPTEGPDTHTDLVGQVLPGYDFISDAATAADGDGRDPDPYDEGDSEDLNEIYHSYHGTHVAGTIAAATDNNHGVAGVDWKAKIVPVRVLGRGGGDGFDIIDGILWAAGASVPGVPANANPAHVINLSLGGPGACDAASRDMFLALQAEGIVVVVAAGNANENAAASYPANCPGVITVGAVDMTGKRSWYSNFGSVLDVMAPGGDMEVDLNEDELADGVLSTGKTAQSTIEDSDAYVVMQGTSMAAPHVAGLASLMLSLDENLTPGQIKTALRQSADPMTVAECLTGGPVSDCGAGRVDALAALQLVQAGNISEPEPEVPGEPGAGGPLLVFALRGNDTEGYENVGQVEHASPVASYTLQAEPGPAYVIAWTDEDGDGDYSPGDFYGEHPDPVTIPAGGTLSNIDIHLTPLTAADLSSLRLPAD